METLPVLHDEQWDNDQRLRRLLVKWLNMEWKPLPFIVFYQPQIWQNCVRECFCWFAGHFAQWLLLVELLFVCGWLCSFHEFDSWERENLGSLGFWFAIKANDSCRQPYSFYKAFVHTLWLRGWLALLSCFVFDVWRDLIPGAKTFLKREKNMSFSSICLVFF